MIELCFKQLYHISSILRNYEEDEDERLNKFGYISNPDKEIPLVSALARLKESAKFDVKVIINVMKTIDYDEIVKLFEKKIKNSDKFKIDFAETQADVYFMLSNNIQNYDPIHIFGSEKRKLIKSVDNFYKSNNEKGNISFHYISCSFEKYLKQIDTNIQKICRNDIKLIEFIDARTKMVNQLRKMPNTGGESVSSTWNLEKLKAQASQNSK